MTEKIFLLPYWGLHLHVLLLQRFAIIRSRACVKFERHRTTEAATVHLGKASNEILTLRTASSLHIFLLNVIGLLREADQAAVLAWLVSGRVEC